MATHPTYTLDQIIHQLTTSWDDGDPNTHTWHAAGHQLTMDGPWGYPTPRLGSGDQLTYSLGLAPTLGFVTESAGIVPMDYYQKGYAQLAFELWDDLVPFSIVQNSSPSADITLNYSSTTAGQGSYTHGTWAAPVNGDEGLGNQSVWLASSVAFYSDAGVSVGGRGLDSMIHEIGHALGLSHPGTYDASTGVGPFVDTNTYATDNRQYTVMSYFGYYDNSGSGTNHGSELRLTA